MVRKVVQKLNHTVSHRAIPSTTFQMGTKESPILLLSDDESGGEETTHHPLEVNAVPQKIYFGVSPSGAYTFKGQGSAYNIMIAMGYKPDRGLGPNLRGSANSRCVFSIPGACLFSPRKRATPADRTLEAQGWSGLSDNLRVA